MDRDLADLPTCSRCDLSVTRTRVVVGAGPNSPALMVIGEAPGRTEDEGGEPFIGRSGQLLLRLIDEELGLERAQCFVTNVVKCRPPTNRTPTKDEIAVCRPWLTLQLATVSPRAVLAVGNTAARALLGYDEGVGVTHGRVVELNGVPAMATYHPAAALRGPSVVGVMRADLATLKTRLANL